MKKLLKLMMAMAFLIVVLAACGDADDNGDDYDNGDDVYETGDEGEGDDDNGDDVDDTDDEDEDTGDDADVNGGDGDVNVFLIAHSPDSILDDGSFNQGAWDGIQRFVADNPGTEYSFLQPHDASDEARLDLIEDAITAGANILVLPGFHFENALYNAQDMFPETTFVLLDASPRDEAGDARVESNVAAIHYAEEEAGFLAGYAAVVEGYRDLGFMGGIAVPAVVRFGHGFIQGADHAAESLGLDEGEVEINFMYLGGFAPDPAHTTTAAAWYAAGTEVIFVAAGGAGTSVMSAAEGEDAAVIGVDVDQGHLSDSVVISAIKGLDVSVYDMLVDFAGGNFDGGNEIRFDASNNGVGLTLESSLLESFSQAEYDNIFEALRDGEIEVNPSLEMDEIPTNLVTVTEM